MKRLALALTVAVCAASSAIAQDPFANEPFAAEPSPSDAKAAENPDSQAYLLMQMLQRYDDPQQAVRRKAEWKAAQRRGRLASQKWFGYSPLRPTVTAVPWTSTYGTRWVSSTHHPYYWGAAYPTTVVRIETLTR